LGEYSLRWQSELFSTLALSSEASNETFTYKQALQQSDYHDFIKAKVADADDHETRKYWLAPKLS
jgi:hypothetical protein